jgi:hypothetical protein
MILRKLIQNLDHICFIVFNLNKFVFMVNNLRNFMANKKVEKERKKEKYFMHVLKL